MTYGTVESKQLTSNVQLPLLAQAGTRLGARWRRVGVVIRIDSELRARFDTGAELFEEVWITRHGRSAPRASAVPAVRFAVSDGEEFVRIIAVCPLSSELSAALRRASQFLATEDGRRAPRRSLMTGGGPRGLHSRWPLG